MYGKEVTVLFYGKLETVMVACVPSTPFKELKERAIKILEQKEEERKQKESDYVMWLLENRLIKLG